MLKINWPDVITNVELWKILTRPKYLRTFLNINRPGLVTHEKIELHRKRGTGLKFAKLKKRGHP